MDELGDNRQQEQDQRRQEDWSQQFRDGMQDILKTSRKAWNQWLKEKE